MKIPASERKSRIYLTGFMGCGKSTIGPILANTIGYDFADIDSIIEQREGHSVSEIFRTNGEAYFRECERVVIAEIGKRSKIVVALGGGSLMDPRNAQCVLNSGILVYLSVGPDEIMRRIHAKTDRPLLVGAEGNSMSEKEFRERIERLFEQRRPFYEMADLTIPADDPHVGVSVDQIVKKLLPLL